ncbi:MAG: nucleotide sugar dehydrogenase, partial [Kiritimatiellia bacterium]|nr:nucleotide sugar dehydrogenase [Kiritimatiellia bacterium]
GLEDLVRRQSETGRLRFTTDANDALRNCTVVWVTVDTPVDAQDEADIESVFTAIEVWLPLLEPGTMILLSSQLPIGSAKRLEKRIQENFGERGLRVACSPENLRLGQALERFRNPDRLVVGCRTESDRNRLLELLMPWREQIEWMGVESAEMTKHAINSFLAASICFINEIAVLSERYGADAAEVARGLKTDSRIGPRAYLSPGAAFAGGTLARDVSYLTQLAGDAGLPIRLIPAIRASNQEHAAWAIRRLRLLWGESLARRRIAVWGLTYKPGTNTLRRSSSVEMCRHLCAAGAEVQAYDPSISTRSEEFPDGLILTDSAEAALKGAEALIVATPWPLFREKAAAVRDHFTGGTVLDAARFLERPLADQPGIRYISVGKL